MYSLLHVPQNVGSVVDPDHKPPPAPETIMSPEALEPVNARHYPHFRSLLAAAAMIAGAWGGAVQADATKNCGEDPDCLRQAYAAHPVKDVSYWRAFQSLPIDRRVLAAPAKLVDYLNLENQLNGFPNRPQAANPQRQFLRDLDDAVRELPAAVKSLIDSRLMGIFLVQDLGGTGFTDYVYDQQHEPVGAFVVLDVDVLTKAANAWATWKENTPFLPDAEIGLQAMIESDTGDNRKQALQFIVLHELGHVASVGSNVHPPWVGWDCAKNPPDRFAFFQLSWQLDDAPGCKVISKFDAAGFSHRAEVVYYFGARLPAAASPDVYAQLEQTNFPSLYAATSPADDFAESFATYVHVVLMGKPFEVRIDRQGERQATFAGCWGTPRCAAKQDMIGQLFSSPR
jgi:hypothetical protein